VMLSRGNVSTVSGPEPDSSSRGPSRKGLPEPAAYARRRGVRQSGCLRG